MVFIVYHCWARGYYTLHTPSMLHRTHRVVTLCVPVILLWAYGSKALGATALHAWMAVRDTCGYYTLYGAYCQHPLGPALWISDTPCILGLMVLVWVWSICSTSQVNSSLH